MAEQKLVWNPDNIKDVAESVGISALNEEAVRALSQDVEYRLGQVITEAMRFMHVGKRTVLGTQDISQALRVLDVEPLYGYESTRPLRFGEASLGPGQPLFYIEDEEVDFEKLINAPLPKVPRDVSFTAHWLAVEGVQPSIPQNPTTAEARANDLVAKGPGANPGLAALAGNDNVTFKPLVKHVVSKELILFFDKVRAAILDRDDDPEIVNFREAALESVRSDPGLHQLVPYFVQFIAEKVTHTLHDIFVLKQMMHLAAAVVANKSLQIDAYVASLIPPILTCLIGRHLGGDDLSLDKMKEKYYLRDLSASLLNQIVTKYGKSSGELQTRLTRTCLKAFLQPLRTSGEHYGAIIGIISVGGSPAVASLIVPNIKPFEYVLKKEGDGNEYGKQMLVSALMKAVMMLVPEGSAGDRLQVNGIANGHTEEAKQVEEYLGSIIGGRVAGTGRKDLIRAVLEVRDKL